MRKLLLLLLLSNLIYTTKAQFGINAYWTWIKGDNNFNQSGSYGTKGVAAATNRPSARAAAAVWSDAAGNTWMYGGNDYADMWKYDPSTNNWTWVHGDNLPNTPPVYGVLGTANAANQPGSRKQSAYWKDNNGKFWLYGGINRPDDLWMFDPVTNIWTWKSGSNTGYILPSYVTGLTPGSRIGSITWTDNTGNLWLFGGSADGLKNDLWKYDVTTNQWSYINPGGPIPTERKNAASWSDNSGNLWVFGGYWAFEYDVSLNDLWKYNIATNQWTMVRMGNYGGWSTQGVPVTHNPMARYSPVYWKDNDEKFWIYGGYYPAICSTGVCFGNLDDLWKYDPATDKWTWMKGYPGFNQPAVYGTMGAASALNRPGARAGAIGFGDNNGNFYLLGGYYKTEVLSMNYPYNTISSTTSYFNDLWKISSTALPLTLLSFAAEKTGNNVVLSWQTANEQDIDHFNIQKSTDGKKFSVISRINAGPSTEPVKKYSYTDLSPFDESIDLLYYRLEITGKDPGKTYSTVATVKNTMTHFAINVLPNPADAVLNISVTARRHETAHVVIKTIAGKAIKTCQLQLVNGNVIKQINIGDLPAGSYVASIITNEGASNKLFIKM